MSVPHCPFTQNQWSRNSHFVEIDLTSPFWKEVRIWTDKRTCTWSDGTQYIFNFGCIVCVFKEEPCPCWGPVLVVFYFHVATLLYETGHFYSISVTVTLLMWCIYWHRTSSSWKCISLVDTMSKVQISNTYNILGNYGFWIYKPNANFICLCTIANQQTIKVSMSNMWPKKSDYIVVFDCEFHVEIHHPSECVVQWSSEMGRPTNTCSYTFLHPCL